MGKHPDDGNQSEGIKWRVLSSCCRFQDPRSHRCHQAQVGFQVCVRPGSYKVGPQTLSHSEPLDPRFSNSEIEWITKEQGGTLLYGLLIRVEWRKQRRRSEGHFWIFLINGQPNPSPALSRTLLWDPAGPAADCRQLSIVGFCLGRSLFGSWAGWEHRPLPRTDTGCTLCFGH